MHTKLTMLTKIIFVALLVSFATAATDADSDECPSRYDITYPGVTVSPRNATVCNSNITQCACLSGSYQGFSFVVSDCADYIQDAISTVIGGIDVETVCKKQNECQTDIIYGLRISCLYSTSECPTTCDFVSSTTNVPTTQTSTVLQTTTHNSGSTYGFTALSLIVAIGLNAMI
uniref:DUF281 domain-containing protein n=1 Tax=Panagrellus redivivus TaxID=6233 RepID=A0A7E4W4C3_PANRE